MKSVKNIIRKSTLIIGLLAVVFSQVAMGQELITLQDAIAIALQENHGIQVAGNSAEISDNNAHIGNAGLLPRVDLLGGATYNDNENQIATGNRNETYTTTTAGIQVSYTLFEGLGNIYTYKKLNSMSAYGALQARATIEQSLVQVSNAYFTVAEVTENLRLANESLAISLERLERARNRSKFGQANTIEVLSAEVDLNADSVSYINAKLALDQAKRDLNVLLNRNIKTDFSVDSRVQFEKKFDLVRLLKSAEQKNASYLMYVNGVTQSEYDVKIAQSAYLPKLDLLSSYGYNQQGTELDIALDNSNRTFSAGVSLSFNLFNGFQNSIKKQNAKIELKNKQLLCDEALLSLKSNVTNVYQAYRNSLYVLEVEQKNLESAQLNFTRTKELYDLGQVTTTQFREAQLNLIRAKNSIANAKYNAKLYEIELLRQSGELVKTNEYN